MTYKISNNSNYILEAKFSKTTIESLILKQQSRKIYSLSPIFQKDQFAEVKFLRREFKAAIDHTSDFQILFQDGQVIIGWRGDDTICKILPEEDNLTHDYLEEEDVFEFQNDQFGSNDPGENADTTESQKEKNWNNNPSIEKAQNTSASQKKQNNASLNGLSSLFSSAYLLYNTGIKGASTLLDGVTNIVETCVSVPQKILNAVDRALMNKLAEVAKTIGLARLMPRIGTQTKAINHGNPQEEHKSEASLSPTFFSREEIQEKQSPLKPVAECLENLAKEMNEVFLRMQRRIARKNEKERIKTEMKRVKAKIDRLSIDCSKLGELIKGISKNARSKRNSRLMQLENKVSALKKYENVYTGLQTNLMAIRPESVPIKPSILPAGNAQNDNFDETVNTFPHGQNNPTQKSQELVQDIEKKTIFNYKHWGFNTAKDIAYGSTITCGSIGALMATSLCGGLEVYAIGWLANVAFNIGIKKLFYGMHTKEENRNQVECQKQIKQGIRNGILSSTITLYSFWDISSQYSPGFCFLNCWVSREKNGNKQMWCL